MWPTGHRWPVRGCSGCFSSLLRPHLNHLLACVALMAGLGLWGVGLPRDPGRPSMRTCNKLAGQAAVLLREPPFAHGWVLLTSFLSVLAGTFITEWKEGGRLCEAFLAGDESSFRAVADQLVLIAQFFRFDGWLINIENSLSVSIAFSWCLPGLALPPPCPSAAAFRGLAGAG